MRLSRRAILVSGFGTALLVGNFGTLVTTTTLVTVPVAVAVAEAVGESVGETASPGVCDSSLEEPSSDTTPNNSCVVNTSTNTNANHESIARDGETINQKEDHTKQQQHDNHDAVKYESPAVEWCRRRPTWKNSTASHSSDGGPLQDCQRLFGYERDLQALTQEKYPHVSTADYHWQGRPTTHHPRDKFGRTPDKGGGESKKQEKASSESPLLFRELSKRKRRLLRKLDACLETALATASTTTNQNQTHPLEESSTLGSLPRPTIAKVHRRLDDGVVVLAEIDNILTEEEAQAVLALSQCLREHAPTTLKARGNGELGGNVCNYLSGFLQILVPGVAHSIQTAAKLVWASDRVGWSHHHERVTPVDVPPQWKESERGPYPTKYTRRLYPDPLSECGIRTAEHLTYDKFQFLDYHEDMGSDYTVVVSLSHPDDYRWGAFSLCPAYRDRARHADAAIVGPDCHGQISAKPHRLSGLVFLSETFHGVEPSGPGRVTFATELWRYGHVPAMMLRPKQREFVLGMRGEDERAVPY